ncbi:MAG: aminoacyl-tRNA hydrolase [Parcubacteria group bacterium]
MSVATKKILVVGLGNPGKKYEFTRHNLGFRVLERLRGEIGMPALKLQKSVGSDVSETNFGSTRVVLLKPRTYMNESGKAVNAALKAFGVQVTNVWVIHVDKDLKLGDLRVKSGSVSAGHRGVESLIKELGSKNFRRYRMGVWAASGAGTDTDKYVLSKFLPEEEPTVRNFIDKTTTKLVEDLGVKR